MSDWLVRALKTFVQAFFGVYVPAVCAMLSGGWPESVSAAWALILSPTDTDEGRIGFRSARRTCVACNSDGIIGSAYFAGRNPHGIGCLATHHSIFIYNISIS